MEIEERRKEAHAKYYPNGCGRSWDSCCDDCCERLGSSTEVYTIFRVGDIYGLCGNSDDLTITTIPDNFRATAKKFLGVEPRTPNRWWENGGKERVEELYKFYSEYWKRV